MNLSCEKVAMRMAKVVVKPSSPPPGRTGTRQYPASTAVQKEMFPLVDRDGLTKPVIQIIGEEAIDSGIEEICIITQPGEEKMYRDYFRRLDVDAKAVSRQGLGHPRIRKARRVRRATALCRAASTPEGFGHAVYQAKKFVGNDPFLLLLGDHVYISDIKDRCARQLIRVFEQYMLDAVTGVQPTLERHAASVRRHPRPDRTGQGNLQSRTHHRKTVDRIRPRASSSRRASPRAITCPFRHARLLPAHFRFAGISHQKQHPRKK
jgi:hypothetical protein